MKKRYVFGIIAYLMAFSLLFLSMPYQCLAATSTELQKEKEELEKQKKEAEAAKKKEQQSLDAANSKVSSISGEMESLQEEIDEVDTSLVETLATIDLINDEIVAKEAEIAETEKEYEAAKAREEEQYSTMKLRIKYMYEKGDYTYMELLIQSQGFSDLVNKVEYIEKLYDYDRRLLLEYEAAKEETMAFWNELEEEKSELDGTLEGLEEEEAYLDELLSKKQAEYDNFEDKLAEAKSQAAVYKAKVQNQNQAIRNLEKQANAKDKEITAAKKAEEEAARKAEEEAKKAAEAAKKSQESENGNSSENSTNSQITKTSETSTESQKSSSKTYASASSFSGGSTGENMVQYALQFVGNPYVYGGTSLTSGADCSGFVWRIYKDFGYTIPRAGTSMRSIGTEVSYENARAGDIICYAGHVALYMGGGKIVHASTAKTGIKVGNATYKAMITIRRVV